MARKHDLQRVNSAYTRIDHEGICVYCGVRADTDDHFVPVVVAATYAEIVGLERLTGLVIVPACRECNTLGGSRVFRTIAEKRRHIQGRLAERHRKLLGSPHWSQEELEPLGRNLRGMIERSASRRSLIWWRLKWRNGSEEEPAIIAAVNFNYAGGRNGSALLDALRPGTRESDTKNTNQLLRDLTFQKKRSESERYGRPIGDRVRPSGVPQNLPSKPARPTLLQRSVFADVAEYREDAWLSDLRLDGRNSPATEGIESQGGGQDIARAAKEERPNDGCLSTDGRLFATRQGAPQWTEYQEIKKIIITPTEGEIERMTKIIAAEMGSSSHKYFYRSGGRSALLWECINRGIFRLTPKDYIYATADARDRWREWINARQREMPRPPHPIDTLKGLTEGPTHKRHVSDNILLFLHKFLLIKAQAGSPDCVQLSAAGRKTIFSLAREEIKMATTITVQDAARPAE